MINGKRVLCVITARGGSKEVPGKNIKELAGKPLIAWTIEAALEASSIDRVLVTTDSEAIANVSKNAGADVPFLRPAELAQDLSKQEDAINHAMDYVEKIDGKYDYIVVLVPTNPFRKSSEVDQVMAILDSHEKAKGIVTVKEASHSPIFSNTLPEDKCLDGFIPEKYRMANRQELPTYYDISGSTCAMSWEYYRDEGSFLSPLTYAFITDKISGHDINSKEDFYLAELYAKEIGLN